MKKLIIISALISTPVFADECTKSVNGNRLCFSVPLSGEHYDRGSWGKMYWLNNGKKITLSIPRRYYNPVNINQLSPSGNYINIGSIEGGYLYIDRHNKKYVDRAYCNVIDLRTGCIVSDWTGGACGYDWQSNDDVLSDSYDDDTLDFLSMKPSVDSGINGEKSKSEIENLLRCDPVNNKNVNIYLKAAKSDLNKNKFIIDKVIDFYNTIDEVFIVKNKTYLHSSANETSKTKSYLTPNDLVKVIDRDNNKNWSHIIYINVKHIPIVSWVRTDDLIKKE